MSLSLHLGHHAHASVRHFISQRRGHFLSCTSLSDRHLPSSSSSVLRTSTFDSTSIPTTSHPPSFYMAPVKRERGQPEAKSGPSRATRSRDNPMPIRAPSTTATDDSAVLITSSAAVHNPFAAPTQAAQGTTPASSAHATPPTSADEHEAATRSSPGTMTSDRDNDVDMNGEPRATSQDAMEVLGGKSRQLIQVVRKLANLNIDATIPSLPKVVVVGDQSAGKSSLVEGICDISLPRDQGTCTRVPIQITTTSSTWGNQQWTAKISLHFTHSFRPKERGMYTKWVELGTMETFHFATIYDKGDLDVTLRRAQLSLLNPIANPEIFVNMDASKIADHKLQIGFSPNVISLEIAAPNLPELSFYDLPGAINTTPNEEDNFLVGFVEKLLKTYMSDEKALILLACPANQDIETSTANKFLRKCKADGRATGVLTKPDLMETTPFRLKMVQEMFSGTVHTMGHGWFVTRHLSQNEILQGVDHEEARAIEADFFNSSPWGDKLSAYADRFGVANLQDDLSRKLTQHILNDLPEIVGRVQHRLEEVHTALATFPGRSADPGMVVYGAINTLTIQLVNELDADRPNSVFRKEYRQILRDMNALFKTVRPSVDITTPGVAQPMDELDAITILSSEDEEDEATPSKRVKTNNGNAATPTNKRQRTPAIRTPAIRTPATGSRGKPVPAELMQQPVRTEFKLDKVQHAYDSAPGADISGETSTTVTSKLCLTPLGEWYHVIEIMLAKIDTTFQRMLNKALQSGLANQQPTLLFKATRQSLIAQFTELMDKQRQSFKHYVDIECHRAVTIGGALGSIKSAETRRLRDSRREHRVREHFYILETRGLKVPTPEGMQKHAHDAKWMAENVGDDPYQREINALAMPLAYYDIASASLLTTLAKHLDFELMHAYGEKLSERLMSDLKVTDKKHCESLLAEDEGRERQRVALEAEKVKLEMALEELNGLPEVHG